ncbi:hypothetical protein J6590_103191 [Homalodisca vitripennis]|nr:hypothetical protein J6590_103191 [Homalodisca vitripennis]
MFRSPWKASTTSSGDRVAGRPLITTLRRRSVVMAKVWNFSSCSCKYLCSYRKWATVLVFSRSVRAVQIASRSPPTSCLMVKAWLAHPLGTSRMMGGMRGPRSTSMSSPALVSVRRLFGGRVGAGAAFRFRRPAAGRPEVPELASEITGSISWATGAEVPGGVRWPLERHFLDSDRRGFP